VALLIRRITKNLQGRFETTQTQNEPYGVYNRDNEGAHCNLDMGISEDVEIIIYIRHMSIFGSKIYRLRYSFSGDSLRHFLIAIIPETKAECTLGFACSLSADCSIPLSLSHI
jgi:hypothetical protein